MIAKQLYSILLLLIFWGCNKHTPENQPQHDSHQANQTKHDALVVAVSSTSKKVFSNQTLIKPLLQTHSDSDLENSGKRGEGDGLCF